MKTAASGQLLGATHSLEEILTQFQSFGIRRIELWPSNIPVSRPSTPHLANRYEGRDLGAARELLDGLGIEPVCLSLDGAFNPLAAEPAEYVRSFLYALDACAELGVGLLNHYCYNFALGTDAGYGPFLEMLEPVIRRAEELGVTLVLENEAHDATARPDRMLEMIIAADSPAFMTTFDVTNYYQASQEGFPAGYEILRPYIRHVHLKNGSVHGPWSPIPESIGGPFSGAVSGNIYYPPLPDGAVNVAGLVSRLVADDYAGYCVLEPHTAPAWAQHYYAIETEYLRTLGGFDE